MKTSLIILNYNQVQLTRQCLESLLPFVKTDPGCEIILVDDGSHDGTPEYITAAARDNPEIIPVILEENVGTMRGRNEGLKRATGAYVLFLDNDTLWRGDVRLPLIRELEVNPSAGVAGMCGVVVPQLFRQVHIDHSYFPRPRPVNAVTGYCLMAKREVLDKGILFDDEMTVTQGEDIEFCLHAGNTGYQVIAVPGVPLEHIGHGALSSYEDRFQEIVIHNMTRMENKWAGKIILPGEKPLETLFMVLSDERFRLERTAQFGKFEFFDVLKSD